MKKKLSEVTVQAQSVSLHAFSDSSISFYTACVFLRTNKDGKVSVHLVEATEWMASVTEVSIPRLELMAALISSRLCNQVKKALSLEDCKTCYFE
jgi:hypothetical protein